MRKDLFALIFYSVPLAFVDAGTKAQCLSLACSLALCVERPGMGMTMLDALDTMWIMGMREEFKEAQEWLAKNIDFDRVKTSVRATTITGALSG
jgi:hypothetical protein